MLDLMEELKIPASSELELSSHSKFLKFLKFLKFFGRVPEKA